MIDGSGLYRISLDGGEIAAVGALLDEVAQVHRSVEDPAFLCQATTYAHELPRRLRREINEFRLLEPAAALVIDGYRLDDDKIGATPENWSAQADPTSTLAEEIYFFLCSSLLGDPVAWAGQQNQRVVHDILPIRGHEYQQINSASESPIWWHTEDAFHPHRAEYVGLMCLRNPDEVHTTFAAMADVKLPREVVDVLFEPRFVIRPDESHQLGGGAHGNGGPAGAEKVAVLFGDRRAPYLRLDPYFMDRIEEDRVAMAALDELIAAIDGQLCSVALRPGQVLFVDNFRAVHGRRPFTARYDGRDRWLKRVNVARDLRKSRAVRSSVESRVVQ